MPSRPVSSPQAPNADSGVLVVDKPQGVTSHDVVAAVRHALRMKRVGHAGTLDPMATGVLVVGFGAATRLLNHIVGADKTYIATIRLGQATETDDADGTPLPADADERARRTAILQGLGAPAEAAAAIQRIVDEHFTGVIEQVPNAYSAIKVDGKRAYDLAREGGDVHLKARPVRIHAFDVREARPAQADGAIEGRREPIPVLDVDVTVTCSAGTYIRALGRDLGGELGVGGHLTMLRRVRVGSFDADAPGVIHAHVESRTFTNREGVTVTRSKAVLDLPEGCDGIRELALTGAQAARRTMPTVDIDASQVRELGFGRHIAVNVERATAAIADTLDNGKPSAPWLVAIVEPDGKGGAKPTAVFPGAQPQSNRAAAAA